MRISKYQAKQLRHPKPKAGEGRGRFVYENNTKGDVLIPGRKTMLRFNEQSQKGEQFEGSDYFLQYVPHMLKIVKVLEPPQETQNTTTEDKDQMQETEKLITEQPPTVTDEGQVEFVTPKNGEEKQLNENPKDENANKDVLLNETPSDDDGIEII